MPAMDKPLCIIPARGGSKRLPRKNIALLAGKPLLSYAIESALQSGRFDEVFISTEDEEIAAIASRFGGSNPGKRPRSFATDKATVVDVCLHVIESFEKKGQLHETVCVLSATCPLLKPKHICDALDLFDKAGAPFLLSITDFDHPPFWALKKDGEALVPFWGKKYLVKTQELPRVYRPNGAICLARIPDLKQHRSFYGTGVIGYYMPRDQSVDIDEYLDLEFAEYLMQARTEENML